jgi:insertion element IS1 protein InsB
LILECDELWSYVGKKQHQKWIWLALNRDTREIVGMAVGARTKATARKLWASLPAVYRHCAICYTDFWQAYAAILPSKRHRAVGKESGHTSHIERFNNTLRQRCSRLVRKTLSFSKKLTNHIGALWYFVHDYNAQRRTKLAITTSA